MYMHMCIYRHKQREKEVCILYMYIHTLHTCGPSGYPTSPTRFIEVFGSVERGGRVHGNLHGTGAEEEGGEHLSGTHHQSQRVQVPQNVEYIPYYQSS